MPHNDVLVKKKKKKKKKKELGVLRPVNHYGYMRASYEGAFSFLWVSPYLTLLKVFQIYISRLNIRLLVCLFFARECENVSCYQTVFTMSAAIVTLSCLQIFTSYTCPFAMLYLGTDNGIMHLAYITLCTQSGCVYDYSLHEDAQGQTDKHGGIVCPDLM